MLIEAHVTIGYRNMSDRASRHISVSISLMNEAGDVLDRHRAHIVPEESLLNPFNAAWMGERGVCDLLLQAQ